jgi:hypothetical protein
MSPRVRVIEGVRELLEQQYLESVGDRSKDEYSGLNDGEQRLVLRAFLQKLTAGSESNQWARVLQDILQTDTCCMSICDHVVRAARMTGNFRESPAAAERVIGGRHPVHARTF